MDFLMRQGRSFVALEVKTTESPDTRHFTGLRAIGDLSGVKRRILVHLGDRPFTTADGIEALPAMHFAQEVLSGRM